MCDRRTKSESKKIIKKIKKMARIKRGDGGECGGLGGGWGVTDGKRANTLL